MHFVRKAHKLSRITLSIPFSRIGPPLGIITFHKKLFYSTFEETLNSFKNYERLIKQVRRSSYYKRDASTLGITDDIWEQSFEKFKGYLFNSMLDNEKQQTIHNAFINARNSNVEKDLMYKLYLNFACTHFEQHILNVKHVTELADLRGPETWYKQAREIKRFG